MSVFPARPATAGAVIAVTAERGTSGPFAGHLLAGDAVVGIVVLAVTVLAATGRGIPTAMGSLAAAAGGRLARALPGPHRNVHEACGRGL
ncbi:hypothetical protein [Streptomyces sp. NPDC000351]|uniref:hypothetical protein n=1 Tax=Streptomyces sp. NPDC000351 TaxID=3154250 RepID=UPI0033332AC9